MVDVAEVKIWGEFVGAVRWDDKRQVASFQFDKKFIDKGWDLSPVLMPINQGERIYEFPELRKGRGEEYDTFKGLPGLLADALPDKYGNQLINVWLASEGRSPNSMNPVEQLCFIGQRGMGALEFEPNQLPGTKQAVKLEVNSLVEVAKKMLAKREEFGTNISEGEVAAMRDILKIGTSAGGARPKAVIAYNAKTGEVRSGQSQAPKGFEHWLIKLDGVSDVQFGESTGWGRIEYAYYLMAIACGLDMSECQLMEEGNRAHFMTKRFDRSANGEKHHIQTWCGLQHFDYNQMRAYSYEQLFQTMRKLRLPYPEAEQMFRRMVFNVLASNCDDHTKNFSFLLKKGGKWELSPAYDICHAYDSKSIWVNSQTLSVNGKRDSITKKDLMTIAKDNNIKKGGQIIDDINKTVSNWEGFASQAKVSLQKTKEIKQNLHVLK
ncbi:MAG: type II toxin-antitoxin system HipA family toxin [Reichenbachiella sp.]